MIFYVRNARDVLFAHGVCLLRTDARLFFCLGGCLVVYMGFLSLSAGRSEIVANSGVSLCSLFVRWVLPSCLGGFFMPALLLVGR